MSTGTIIARSPCGRVIAVALVELRHASGKPYVVYMGCGLDLLALHQPLCSRALLAYTGTGPTVVARAASLRVAQ